MLKYGSYFGCNEAVTISNSLTMNNSMNIGFAGFTFCYDGIPAYNANLADPGQGEGFITVFDTIISNSIKSISNDKEIFISPNPNNGNFTISGTVANDNAVMIAVYNMLGQVVVQQKALPHNGKLQAVFSAPQLLPGVYLVQLSNSATIANLRMVVE